MVFERPRDFDPQRFIRKPALKQKVYAFGAPPKGTSSYRCAGAANRTAFLLVKAMIARLGRATSWRMTPAPVMNVERAVVEPASLTWHRS